MKKLLLLPLLLLTLTGCNDEKVKTYSNSSTEGMVLLCKHYVDECGRWVYFVRDLYTDNIYMMTYEGAVTPYYNKDGVMMKYSEFQRVHKHN